MREDLRVDDLYSARDEPLYSAAVEEAGLCRNLYSDLDYGGTCILTYFFEVVFSYYYNFGADVYNNTGGYSGGSGN